MTDYDEVVAALRRSAADDAPHARAAVEVLIWHGGWLRRGSFIRAAVEKYGPDMSVSWRKAREFHDSNPRGSTSELAILDYAVALGEDRFRIGGMGHAHRRAMANAMMIAAGLAEPAPAALAGKEQPRCRD